MGEVAAPDVSAAPGKLWPALPSRPSQADSMCWGPVPQPHIMKTASALVLCTVSITRCEKPTLMGSVQLLHYCSILNWRKKYQGSTCLQATGGEDFTTSCASSNMSCCHSSRAASSARLGHHCEPLAGGDAILHWNVTATNAVGLVWLRYIVLRTIHSAKRKKDESCGLSWPCSPHTALWLPQCAGRGWRLHGVTKRGEPSYRLTAVLHQMWWQEWECPALEAEQTVGAVFLHTTIFSFLAPAPLRCLCHLLSSLQYWPRPAAGKWVSSSISALLLRQI